MSAEARAAHAVVPLAQDGAVHRVAVVDLPAAADRRRRLLTLLRPATRPATRAA